LRTADFEGIDDLDLLVDVDCASPDVERAKLEVDADKGVPLGTDGIRFAFTVDVGGRTVLLERFANLSGVSATTGLGTPVVERGRGRGALGVAKVDD